MFGYDECVEGVLVSWVDAEPDQQCEQSHPHLRHRPGALLSFSCARLPHTLPGCLVGGVDKTRRHWRGRRQSL